jgi:hypothetical protein
MVSLTPNGELENWFEIGVPIRKIHESDRQNNTVLVVFLNRTHILGGAVPVAGTVDI